MLKIIFSGSRPTFTGQKSKFGELAQPWNFHRIFTCAIAYNDMIFTDVFLAIFTEMQMEIFNI